jgi:hypothetical protein
MGSIRKVILLIACCALSAPVSAQISWPVITSQTKPWARWWWQGSAVNEKDLTGNMQLYRNVGLGGLEVTPIYGVKGSESQFIQYLSPAWVDKLIYTLKEAKRLDLGIDMSNASGWPFGGPWIGDADASKDVVVKTYFLHAGEQLKDTVQYIQQPLITTEGVAPAVETVLDPIGDNKNLQALALAQVKFKKPLPLQTLVAYGDNGQCINLTDKVDANGKLNWLAPAGDWNLYGVFMGWHGKMVKRASPGAEGFAIDHFSEDAIKTYLNHFSEAFKGREVSGIRAFFNDSYEVDDARGQSDFTPHFFDEFKKRRGYDLREHLPQLFAKTYTEDDLRVLCDYRETISDLMLYNFTLPWHSWAKARGALIRNQAHGSPANILDLYSASDIPETEGKDPLRFKFATSAAHVSGKKLVSSESATWLDDHFLSSISDVKQAIDKYFLGGVNHVFYHGISYSPQSAKWPGWLFYAAVHFVPNDPTWRDFSTLNQYIARCQSFLQLGKADNKVLLYYPIFDSYSEAGKALLKHYDNMLPEFKGTGFEATATTMLNSGYGFDYISDKQIANLDGAVGQLNVADQHYQTIILPDCHYIPEATFNKLVQFANDGAQIIIYKNIPVDVPGLANLESNRKLFKGLLAKLNFQDAGSGIKKAVIGKGAFLLGDDINQLLAFAAVKRESLTDEGLQFTRRKYDKGYYYFLVNNSKSKVDGWVPLGVKANSVVLFDPMFKQSGLAKIRRSTNGYPEIYLQLSPGDSRILQTTSQPVKGNNFAYYQYTGKSVDIKGTWAVKFLDGGPVIPAETHQTNLTSWTTFGGDDVKRFSGTAAYAITFAKPAYHASAWELNLGEVHETAEVYLNGKKLATLIGPNYQVVIPSALLKQDNQLEVRVSNLMVNRIIDMDKRKIPYKIFYNTNFPAHFKENRGADGLFNTSSWELKPSGLIGPVKLEAVNYLRP